MTVFDKWIAKLGAVGILGVLLAISVAVNLWQLSRLSTAGADCQARIDGMVADVAVVTARQESTSLQVGRETADRAGADTDRIQTETIRYVERIRTVEVPVPAECHAPMPGGVQDALADAARAANRRL